MGEVAKWLLHDDQKELFEFLFAGTLNIVFLALMALLLWPLGRALMALRMAKGFWVFWVVMYVTAVVALRLRRMFRVDIDSHYDAYVISALVVSGFLQAGWSAFAAHIVQSFVAGAPVWVACGLYLAGLLSCHVAFNVVSAFYGGQLYRLVNLPLALISFVVFSVWPAGGRAVYGWFFDLFGKATGS
jgi:hypothetical protein